MPPANWVEDYTARINNRFKAGHISTEPLGRYYVYDTLVPAMARWKKISTHWSVVDGITIQSIAQSLAGAIFIADSEDAKV